MTLSKRYLLDNGKTNPESVLMPVKTSPRSMIPRRGRMSAQISGRDCQLIFFLAFLAAGSAVRGTVVAVVDIVRWGSWEDTPSMRGRAKGVRGGTEGAWGEELPQRHGGHGNARRVER